MAAGLRAQRPAAHRGRRRSASSGRSRRSACSSPRSATRVDITTTGWWTALLQPVRGEPVDAGELPDVSRQRGLRHGLHQQPRRDHPGDRHPDHDRRVRGLCLRLDQFPVPRVCCSRSSSACWSCRCRCRSSRSCGCTAEVRLNGTFLGIWLAHTAFGLPLAIFLLYNFISQLPTRPVRVGRHRRRVAFPGVHAPRAAAVDPGPRRLRDLPVPVGLERPAGGAGLPGRRRAGAGAAIGARWS